MVSRERHQVLPFRTAAKSWPKADGASQGWVSPALLAVPGLGIALVDWIARRELIAAWPAAIVATYIATLVLGGVLWGALVAAAGAPGASGARVLLMLGATFAVGAQLYFFGRYHAYMNPRAVIVGTSMLPSVGQQLWSDRASFLRAVLPPVVLAALLVVARRGSASMAHGRAGRALDVAVGALLVAAFGVHAHLAGSQQGASPDVLYVASLGRLAMARWNHDEGVDRARPGPRTPVDVAPIAVRAQRRSVLFVVTESVRATDACSLPSPDCSTTPFTNALLPDRFGFVQMRALDSTTALSLAVLWSGLPPTASRKTLHTAPLLWEYAHAAGFDTAYWTSQNLLFANSGTWLEGLPLSHRVSATDLERDPTYELGADDARLVDVAVRDLPAMRAPFVGVVHLSNTHFPYVIDDSDAPFQPQTNAFGAGDAAKVHNRYKDAIHRQDALVAHLVGALRAMPGGDHVVVVFVSDHGEQIRERGAIGHTWGVYDEEVRVPFWIDAPRGALTRDEETRLHGLAGSPLTELDVLPTLLDLMGIWDAQEVAPFRRAMPGQSLLRGGTPGGEVVLTNCSGIFDCAFKNWGAMRGTKKLLATQNSRQWECFDVARDPDEHRDLGVDACGDLRAVAEGEGRGTPF
ncbi:MAG: sulfatase-like hydrolase/transferase [Myxococcota bacterium]|nr:sulfatase-like hydrolase/transferase [Myxococcota bacterium]